jgi:hypothetical protein
VAVSSRLIRNLVPSIPASAVLFAASEHTRSTQTAPPPPIVRRRVGQTAALDHKARSFENALTFVAEMSASPGVPVVRGVAGPYRLIGHGCVRQLTPRRLRKVQEILREAPLAWPARQRHSYDVAGLGR